MSENFTQSDCGIICLADVDSQPENGTVLAHDLISDDVARLFIFIDFVLIYTMIGLCGIVVNIINIVVFVKMGLADPVNVSLLFLSISDLGTLFSLVWLSIYYYPLWEDSELAVDPLDLKQMTASCSIFYFKRVGAVITAFITFERCLYISKPLKVKQIITVKRTRIILASIFILLIFTEIPKYFMANFQHKFIPERNQTSLVLVYNQQQVAKINPVVSGLSTALFLLTYVLVITCTLVMVINFRKKTKGQMGTAGNGNTEAMSSYDMRVVKTMIFLAVIFIVSFLPEVALLAVMTIDYRVNYGKQYQNVFLVLVGISETLLALNASVNIIVYLRTSSKFRATFSKYFYELQTENKQKESTATSASISTL